LGMTSKQDSYYTPSDYAVKMADSIPSSVGLRIVDPAAGGGSLLRAAQSACPGAALFAIDSDPQAVALLHKAELGISISQANFLSNLSLRASNVGRSLRQTPPDLILLNPPFSYRGQEGVPLALG
ncbi:methyltransferase, partial [Klebsiella pneumoniae]|uniref:methyltransferase n=1 Tax=Klebsiella pneumoniae TaxID=573 RepID=UPI002731BD20